MSNPIVLAGQVYLHRELNEYIVVTKNRGGRASFSGPSTRGYCDIGILLNQEVFFPVDPAELKQAEAGILLDFCTQGTVLSTGTVGVFDECLED